jgi:hypothetical protein
MIMTVEANELGLGDNLVITTKIVRVVRQNDEILVFTDNGNAYRFGLNESVDISTHHGVTHRDKT